MPTEVEVPKSEEPLPEKPVEEASVETKAPEEEVPEAEPTETDEIEKGDETPRAETPHDESDFEDNITVTVPPPHFQSNNPYRERHLNGRHGRHLKPPGMDTPPKNPSHHQVSI